MYSVILATMLTASSQTPNWCHWRHGCWHGCYTSHTCYSCYGCSCFGCYSGWAFSSYGYYGYYSGACFGSFCNGGYHGWGCSCSYYPAVVSYAYAYPSYSAYYAYGHGCCGGVVVAPTAQPVPAPAPQQKMPAAVEKSSFDSTVTPRTQAEHDAIQQMLRTMRERKSEPLVTPVIPNLPKEPKLNLPGGLETSARVTVQLPAHAQLYVDQVKCPLEGEVRSFTTPALAQGREYYYTLQVTMERDGQIVNDQKRVNLSAGGEVTVDFRHLNLQTVQR